MKPRKPRISRAAASDDALAQLAEIERQARAAIAAQDRDEYTLGVLWNRLAAGGWTRKAKLGSPKSWWREHIPDEVDVRMAEMFGRLARAFSQEVVERYHATSLDLYLRYCKKEGLDLYPISAVTGKGIEELKWAMAEKVEELRKESAAEVSDSSK